MTAILSKPAHMMICLGTKCAVHLPVQVTSPCELEQCDEDTLAAILETDPKVMGV